jgi:hypothetical protein
MYTAMDALRELDKSGVLDHCPFDLDDATQAKETAARVVKDTATDLDRLRYWQCIARDLAGALDACTNQIEQMRGMFGDDPDIDRAMEDADESLEAYRVAASTP